MQQNISPLPWAVVRETHIIPAEHKDRLIGCSTDVYDHVEKFAHVIAVVSDDKFRFSATEVSANAAFIVKACNAHDQLVGAIKYLIGCSVPMSGQQEECWKSLRAALAAAGAE